MDHLSQLTNAVSQRIEKTKQKISFEQLKQLVYKQNRCCYCLTKSFVAKKTKNIPALICEFKRKSPSKGVINANADVFSYAQIYQNTGATAISILTNADFLGSLMDIELLRDKITIPILNKEFIIDEYQIYQAKLIGADFILLIASCLSIEQCQKYIQIAHHLGLEVLLELHDLNELDYCQTQPDLIGINNRNLKTFKVDLNQSIEALSEIKTMKTKGIIAQDTPLISESGIDDRQTIQQLFKLGFDGFLVGESLMKANDPQAKLKELLTLS